MSEYKIEKNIPMPERRLRGGVKYPFAGLGVNESFFVPCEPRSKIYLNVQQYCSNANLKHKRGGAGDIIAGRDNLPFEVKRFISRRVDESSLRVGETTGGIRVWRVE